MAGMCAVVVAFLILPLCPLHPAQAEAQTTFIFNHFNASTLTLMGNASIHSNAICLTNQSQHVVGRALYSQPLNIKDRRTFSFSTTFVFTIVSSFYNPSQSGHGPAFIMTPHKSAVGVLAAQYLGLLNNISSIGQPYNHLFAVEFDTDKNEELKDINNNHVGVDLNDLTSLVSERAGYWNGNNFQDLDLNNGHNIQAWIDYNHLQKELNVTIAQVGSLRPEKPLISKKNLTLSDILTEEMYVGFSAATGTIIVEDHYILAWSFTTKGVAPVLDISRLPSFIHKNSSNSKSRLIAIVTSCLVILLSLVVVVAAVVWQLKRNKYGDLIEEWEMEYWPHRFDYKDLHVGTKGFPEEHLIGRGGFGKVYKGVLPSNGLEIAVKCILRENIEGVKEFVAEISSLGRLQHRNLVQIRGYCRRGKQLFIVYDYMPNGSLDKMIFGNPRTVLPWPQRYRILKDVASGLLYLHEEWEQRVVHRDIKSSNVLLDSELNGKLGDFGLARLYEHNENSKTTRVVGTLGYIAPELIHTGKAFPTTDVFSFGVLMLEVACGRRPVDTSLDASQVVMVDWVRELHANNRVIVAADPKLGVGYNEDEMKRVLNLGLLCSNPHPEKRLGMRQVVQILEGEVCLPDSLLPYSLETNISSRTLIHIFEFSSSTSLEGR